MRTFKKLIAIVGIFVLSLMINFSFFINDSFAVPSTFIQTDWIGGQTSHVANDTSNQIGWNEYSSKDTSIGTTTELVLQGGGGSVTQTSDTDFALGTDNNTDTNGTGNSAAIELLLASGEQVIDISSSTYFTTCGAAASCSVF